MDLPLNNAQAKLMHIDINSCFATIEQQANPFLRGKPLAVVAHNYSNGVILAASIEAKRYGIKTGMLLYKAKLIYPKLITRLPDPDKYKDVHVKFRKIISDYSDDFYPKSIDEFIVNLDEILSSRVKTRDPGLDSRLRGNDNAAFNIAKEIKMRIRQEIGEFISVSIGIGTNRFWAKTAANYKKPDGLTLMDYSTAKNIYKNINLVNLHGINIRYELRLNKVGIHTPLIFLNSNLNNLKAAFQSVNADYWYTRLRGYETDSIEFGRKSFGNTYSMPGGPSSLNELAPILMKLTSKAAFRLRNKNYKTKGIHVGVRYKDYPFWHKGKKLNNAIFNTNEIYKFAFEILKKSPRKPVANLAVTCFNLTEDKNNQLNIFSDVLKQRRLTDAVDTINTKWNKTTIFSARMLSQINGQADAIGFGNIAEVV